MRSITSSINGLVVVNGHVVDRGTHWSLVDGSATYRQIVLREDA
jgi:ABC-type transport system involved in Fe-S cluster assembly fused permease/ATPase subunit